MLMVILVRFTIIILVLNFNVNEGGIAMTMLLIGMIILDIGTVNIDINFNTCYLRK
jgi:hypothetical protein